MSDFFRTQMGQRFYESTMPSLVRELAKLNENVARLVAALERDNAPKQDQPEPPPRASR